ncbi:hypothetical protein H9L39_18762 [Fusarium oxysporum f. sp. albedinis]|nr:hypothetical protein H9L39_18762 [Fusarium oxysporum f. sp. albedinis]
MTSQLVSFALVFTVLPASSSYSQRVIPKCSHGSVSSKLWFLSVLSCVASAEMPVRAGTGVNLTDEDGSSVACLPIVKKKNRPAV